MSSMNRSTCINVCPACGSVRYPRGEWIEAGNQAAATTTLMRTAAALDMVREAICDHCAARHIYMTEAAGD